MFSVMCFSCFSRQQESVNTWHENHVSLPPYIYGTVVMGVDCAPNNSVQSQMLSSVSDTVAVGVYRAQTNSIQSLLLPPLPDTVALGVDRVQK